ncbi:cupin domain-containing protein [Microbacterium sp. X-17]|uniref:cupin domain-containing protein n=1 Tax=Microbacterium sp. X-17 TaxID=3144404 RepID=UPI0031F511C8
MSETRLGRIVLVGTDRRGRSAVLADGVSGVSITRPSGAVVHEIWRQQSLPVVAASVASDLEDAGEMAPLPPREGVSVRLFTLPPEVAPSVPVLNRSAAMHVATVVSGRALLVLEASEVLLEAGDSFVIPGSLHAWRNPFDETAVMVSTVLALSSPPATGR